MSQRLVAVATGRTQRHDPTDQPLGLVQSSRDLAGYHRLDAEGFANGLCPSGLEGQFPPRAIRRLEAAGIRLAALDGSLEPGQLLVLGPEGASRLGEQRSTVEAFLKAGGRLLALGWTHADAAAPFPIHLIWKQAEHINTVFDPPRLGSPLAGIGPAHVHCRDPRILPPVAGGAPK